MPVSNPLRDNMYNRSSVATLPVAFGANGQPPIPPTLESNVCTPAITAAYALATAVLRVLWKWQRSGTPFSAGSSCSTSAVT